jgi:hypothetical protein
MLMQANGIIAHTCLGILNIRAVAYLTSHTWPTPDPLEIESASLFEISASLETSM